MWKCTLVLFYYLCTLLGTTFISLIGSAPVNYTISATTTTSTTPEPNDDDASLVTTHKIVSIVGGIIGAIIGLTTFVFAVCKLRRTDFNCKCCNKGPQRYEEVPLENLQPGTSRQEQAQPSSQPTAKQRKKEDLPVKKRSTLVGKQAVLLEEFEVETVPTDVQWYNFNGPIPEDDKYQVMTQPASSKLTIKKTTVQDYGNYRCKVRNSNGEYTQIFELKVTDCEPDDVEKPLDFKDIKAKMKTQYVEKKIIDKILGKEKYIIHDLPGEKQFNLDLREDEQLMELDFQTERLEEKVGWNARATTYNWRFYEQIEDIITESFTENTHRVAQCTANAGCGKTIFANKLVCDWFYESDLKPHLKNIDMVIFIPIRDIDPKATLEDMLGEEGLQLFDQKYAGRIVKYLKTEHEKSCLFLLDGVDEKDIPEGCDLYKLITGDICKSAKVMITGRPEAELFNKKEVVPDYKIQISGTTIEGAQRYIKEKIKRINKSDTLLESDIEKYIVACKDSQILTIPLFLTLVVIMFNEYFAENATFSNFKVPTTETELFNSLFRILIRRWANKILKEKVNNSKVTFERNPFEEGTTCTVPDEVMEKLYTMAELSYKFLKSRKYDFSKKDLDENHVKLKDIALSGLFCQSDSKFFYRHKLLQEYMAALYFVHPRCPLDIVNVPGKKVTLQSIFRGLSNVPKFIFGLKPSKGKEIIKYLRGHTLTETSYFEPCIKYEAELCYEANDKEVTEGMVQLLCDSETYQSEFSICDNKNKDKFYKSLTGDQSTSLLSKWYNLTVDSETETDQWCLVRGVQHNKTPFKMEFDKNTNHVSGLILTDTLLRLIHVYMFPTMSSAGKCLVPISTIFPELHQLVLNCKFTSDMLHISANSTIRHITVYEIPHHWNEILELNELETLAIASKFTDISSNRFDIKLVELHTLLLDKTYENPGMIESKNTELFLKSLPALSVISVRILDLEITEQTIDEQLLQHIQKITNLKKLHVCTSITLSRDCIQQLCDLIKGMNQLTDIGLDMVMFLKHGSQFMLNKLMEAKNISSIEILYDTVIRQATEEKEAAAYVEAQQLLEDMKLITQTEYPDRKVAIMFTHLYPGHLQPSALNLFSS